MTQKDKILKIPQIIQILAQTYPDAKCSLDYTTPHELLVAVMLSAQCTDARVNIVTKELFERYKNVEDFANADLDELMSIVKPCGFYKNKAKNIISASADILNLYGGKVPDTVESLTSLAGVGRKTANLILGDIYGKPGLVIDTHAIRITNRLGLTKQKDPVKIEFELKKIIPPEHQIKFCHRIVHHGRAICSARKPQCEICPLAQVCDYGKGQKGEK